MAVSQHILVLL